MGIDALGAAERVTMETAQSLREDFLQQNAFDEEDSYTSAEQMYALMELIFSFDKKMRAAVEQGADVAAFADLPVRERIGRAKSVSQENYKAEYASILAQADEQIAALIG